MALKKYLSDIKSAGVYRFVFDKSEIIEDTESVRRLLVGYSEKGPFNTPVYINDIDTFITTFGTTSRRMERKGIYLNRLAQQALEKGPIQVLNLKPFNVDKTAPEMAAIYAFNASDLGNGVEGHDVNYAYVASTSSLSRGSQVASIYDTNRFWKVDPERLHDIKMYGSSNGGTDVDSTVENDYIRLVQTSSYEDSCTVFIRPYIPDNYNITISDWYSAETSTEMPSYLDAIKDHYLDEFWAEVLVFKGDLRKSALFAYTGTLGSNLPYIFNYNDDGYIESITVQENDTLTTWYVNDTTYNTVEEFVEKFLLPNNLVSSTSSTTLDGDGVSGTEFAGLSITELTSDIEPLITWQPFCVVTTDSAGNTVVTSNPNYKDLYGNPADALDAMADVTTSNYLGGYRGILIPSFTDANGSYISLDTVFNSDYSNHKMLMHFNEALLDEVYDTDLNSNGVYDSDEGTVDVHGSDSVYTTPASILHALLSATCKVMSSVTVYTITETKVVGTITTSETFATVYVKVFNDENSTTIVTICDGNGDILVTDNFTTSGASELTYTTSGVTITATSTDTPTAVYDESNNTSSTTYTYVVTSTSSYSDSDDTAGSLYEDYTSTDWTPDGATTYGKFMEGYTYASIKKSDKGQTLVNKIYGVLSYKGIYEALTNNVDSDYHYIVDTFQGYPGKAMKSQIATIAKKKFNCLAIVNFPPIADVIKYCGYNSYLGGFDMSTINKSSSNISMPSESQGASWLAFYTQLNGNEGGNKFTFPSAAIVSNLFETKWEDKYPYTIVAGPKWGRVSQADVTGPDYNYARADLDALEPFGVNAIIYQPHYGVYINGNQTAKQKPKSALSKVHVRELVTYLQDEIEVMLRGYHFDLNTATLRDTVRAKAETILGLCQANGGIYAYHVTCDDTNNTSEIIDNDMLILDYDIEPARGAEKMVQRLTIRKTGDLAKIYGE